MVERLHDSSSSLSLNREKSTTSKHGLHFGNRKRSQSNSSTATPTESHRGPIDHDDPSASPASHFLSSVITVAQNAASSLAGLKPAGHPGGASDTSFFTNTEESLNSRESTPAESVHRSLNDVKIEHVAPRPTISTLGQGELSLASLDSERPEEDTRGMAQTGRDTAAAGPDNSHQPGPPMGGNGSPLPADNHEFHLPDFHPTQHKVKLSADSPEVSRNASLSLPSRQKKPRSIDDDELSATESHGIAPLRSRASHPKVSGFAYANKKRNREFHRLFKSVHPDDYLLDDFSCALSREILVHGRMYVSEKHICFNSNILGWVTNLIIGFDEIVAMERKSTAGLFPNGILIQTLHARHSFASFVSRDSVLDFLNSIWQQSSPHQASRSAIRPVHGRAGDSSDSEGDSSDDEDDARDGASGDEASITSSYGSSGENISDYMDSDQEFGDSARANKPEKTDDGAAKSAPASGDDWPVPLEGPATHAPTEVPALEANDKQLCSEVVKAPLGVVANMLFGSNTAWIKRFIVENQKNTKLSELGEFKSDNGKKVRKYDYIKPLNGPVGPKQTKCICTETIDQWDLNKCVITTMSVATPDVPSGNSFLTKSKTSLCWAEDNSTRIVLSYHIEWSGKSWLKGPIEKGAQDGQNTWSKELVAEINNSLRRGSGAKKKPTGDPKARKGPSKKKHKKGTGKVSEAKVEEQPKSLISQVLSLIMQNLLITGVVLGTVLLLTIAISSLVGSRSRKADHDKMDLMHLEEQFELWRWIDDRSQVSGFGASQDELSRGKSAHHREPFEHPRPDSKRRYDSYTRQELEEVIRITEFRLNLLKQQFDVV